MTLPLSMALLAKRQRVWTQALSQCTNGKLRHASSEQDVADTSRQLAVQHTPNTLWELVTSMSSALAATGPALSLGELLWGTQVLAAQHAQAVHSPQDELQGRRVTDKQVLSQLLEAVDFAAAAYKRDKYVAAATCRLKVHDIVVWHGTSKGYLAPGYFIALDHVEQEVVWSVRGTSRLLDLVTDLTTAHPALAGEGQTHWGMHQAARWLLSQEGATIKGLLRALPGYRLHLVGHSMGGGVAALLAYMAHTEPPVGHALVPNDRQHSHQQVHATCIAPPCIMSKDLANSCRPFVRSLILGDDLVPRLNTETASALMSELRATDWRPQVASLLGLQPILDQYSKVSASVQENLPSSLTSLPSSLTYDVAVAEKLVELRDGLARGMWGTAGAEAVKAKVQELARQVSETWQDSGITDEDKSKNKMNGQQSEAHKQELDMYQKECGLNNQESNSDIDQSTAGVSGVVGEHGRGSSQECGSTEAAGQKGSAMRSSDGSAEDSSGDNAGSWFDERKWGDLWRQGVQAASGQLEAWQRVLPVSARQALLQALSLPRASDPLSLLKLLPFGGSDGDAQTQKDSSSSGSSSSGSRSSSAGSSSVGAQLPASSLPRSKAAKAAVESTPEAVVASDGMDSEVQTAAVAAAAAETTSRPQSMPTLYPAGQLYYIRKLSAQGGMGNLKVGGDQSDAVGASALDDDEMSGEKSDEDVASPASASVGRPLSGSSNGISPLSSIPNVVLPQQAEVLDVPPDAKFFGRVLLVRRAVQDHRNRAYRTALCTVLGRPVIRP